MYTHACKYTANQTDSHGLLLYSFNLLKVPNGMGGVGQWEGYDSQPVSHESSLSDSLSKKLYPHWLVLAGSKNVFECDLQ